MFSAESKGIKGWEHQLKRVVENKFPELQKNLDPSIDECSIQIRYNYELSETLMARALENAFGNSRTIELNPFMEYKSLREVRETLAHELTHFVVAGSYSHSKEFNDRLARAYPHALG